MPRVRNFESLGADLRVRVTCRGSVATAFFPAGIATLAAGATLAAAAAVAGAAIVPASGLVAPAPRSIAELPVAASLHVGHTADWVAITPTAIWVGSTGPNAVHRIDPRTNHLVVSVKLPGEPCAGLATGFGYLWVPLCATSALLAKVDLGSNHLAAVLPIGPAGAEGGIATGAGSVWLVVDKSGSLARIDPATGATTQTIHLPAGSYNPRFAHGHIWITRADGAELTDVNAATGKIAGSVRTGPNPRFLTSAGGSIWTLNQGDGTLTRVDASRRRVIENIALGTPGHGGDISAGAGMIWTSMPKVPLSAVDASTNRVLCQWAGSGGDSLGIGHGAIWLTDYHAGSIARIFIKDAIAHCHPD